MIASEVKKFNNCVGDLYLEVTVRLAPWELWEADSRLRVYEVVREGINNAGIVRTIPPDLMGLWEFLSNSDIKFLKDCGIAPNK